MVLERMLCLTRTNELQFIAEKELLPLTVKTTQYGTQVSFCPFGNVLVADGTPLIVGSFGNQDIQFPK